MNPFIKHGLFEAVGHAADRWSEKLGVHNWPWIIRFLISIAWDFLVDIPVRLIFWIPGLFIPFLLRFVRSMMNIPLFFLGFTLWGASGFLELLEVFGDGFLSDVIPMLTVEGIIDRFRGGARKIEPSIPAATKTLPRKAAERKGVSVEAIAGLFGILLGGGLWWLGYIGFFSAIGLAILIAIGGFLLRAVSATHVPVAIFQALLAILVVGVIGSVGRLVYLNFTTTEDYRLVAWNQLRAESNVMIAAAEKADAISESLSGATGGLLDKARKGVVEGLKDHKFGIRGLDELFKSAPKEERAQETKETKTPQVARVEDEIRELKLGSMQAKLYRSDFVRDRAVAIRDGIVSFWWTVFFWAVGLLAFVFAAFFMEGQEVSEAPCVEPEDEDRIDDWI